MGYRALVHIAKPALSEPVLQLHIGHLDSPKLLMPGSLLQYPRRVLAQPLVDTPGGGLDLHADVFFFELGEENKRAAVVPDVLRATECMQSVDG